MVYHPKDFLRALIDGDASPQSYELHAALYRLCEAHAGVLDSRLGQAPWRKFAARTCSQVVRDQRSYRRSWRVEVRKLLADLMSGDEEKLLVGCSAVLQALDGHHQVLGGQEISRSVLPSRSRAWTSTFTVIRIAATSAKVSPIALWA